jgi:hypothetical protein
MPVFTGTLSDWALVILVSGIAAIGVSGQSDTVAHPKTANDNMTNERLFVIGALLRLCGSNQQASDVPPRGRIKRGETPDNYVDPGNT